MKKRQILTTSLGNTLEWFDFGLFIFMAPIIGAKFFPQQSPGMATIEALMVFAAGFICRPLGGIFFGHYGDTRGRAKTLRISVLIITIATLLVGLLPSYETAGIYATISFIILRLAQGISIGGEYSGVMIYLAESAPTKQRGFITSFAATGANIGFLCATLTYMLLQVIFSAEIIADWAWRLPFILAGLPGSFILYTRFKLTETRVYSHLETTHHVEHKPFIAAIKYAPTQLIKIFGLTCMNATFYYVFFGYMPTYLNQYIHIPLKQALTMQSILLVAMLFIVPLAGFCGDLFSRKKMMMLTALSVCFFVIPAFHLFQLQAIWAIMLSLSIATILISFDQGNSLTAVVENCSENIRYTGIAFAYNLGNALLGGTAPLVVTVLTEKYGVISPAYYLLFMAFMTFLVSCTLLSHNKMMGYLSIPTKKT